MASSIVHFGEALLLVVFDEFLASIIDFEA